MVIKMIVPLWTIVTSFLYRVVLYNYKFADLSWINQVVSLSNCQTWQTVTPGKDLPKTILQLWISPYFSFDKGSIFWGIMLQLCLN